MTAPDDIFFAFQRAVAGRYSLERELGRGGMGIVYLAREVSLDRPVAVKLLPPHLAARAELRERFVREAMTAAKLSHPNIVPIYRVDEHDGFVYFVMAYVDGETLAQRVKARGSLAAAEVTRMLREVAWALAYAHARGIVHRDVKPDNILLERGTGRALVTDFGIAQVAEGAAITGEGLVMGTAHFMSPEQASGDALDGRSDLYALGLVAHHALTGRYAFDAETVPAILAKQMTEAPPPLAAPGRVVPRALADAIGRCLAKRASERFATGEALADALEAREERSRELPVPLRVWLNKADPLAPLYVVWSAATVWIALYSVGRATMQYSSASPRLLLQGAVLAALGVGLPAIAHVKVRLFQTRQALAAGLTLADLQLGLREYLRTRREELAYEESQAPSLGGRVLRAVAYAGLGVATGIAGVMLASPAIGALPFVPTLFGVGAAAAVGAGVAGLAFPGRRISHRGYGRLRERIWNSRLGEWATRIAGLGLRARAEASAYAHRPTEVAIGLAADQLFAALPRATRETLRELPPLVRRLEDEARRMRERVDALGAQVESIERGEGAVDGSTSLARAGSDVARALDRRRGEALGELRGARDAALARLGTVVAALENIRLDLLRLQAGDAASPSLTTLVEISSRLGREVDTAMAAHDEVSRVLASFPEGSITERERTPA